MYLIVENRITLEPRDGQGAPLGSVFLLGSVTNLGVSAHHTILHFLTESQTGLPALCPELSLLRFFAEIH